MQEQTVVRPEIVAVDPQKSVGAESKLDLQSRQQTRNSRRWPKNKWSLDRKSPDQARISRRWSENVAIGTEKSPLPQKREEEKVAT